jgi:ZIP family zinc transporter
LWGWVVLACGIASVLGFGARSIGDEVSGARMAAFASGGILATLSNSLIPFANERSPTAGFWTVVGFCTSFAMT